MMQPAVTLATLYPPIAAATIVNAFLFAGMWRGYQAERRGKAPWWLTGGFAAYGLLVLGLVYFRSAERSVGWFDMFGAALVGEALGAAFVYTILNLLIFTKGRPRKERVSALLQSAGVLLMLTMAFLIKP